MLDWVGCQRHAPGFYVENAEQWGLDPIVEHAGRAPGPVLTNAGNLAPHLPPRDSIPGPSSPYRLPYPPSISIQGKRINLFILAKFNQFQVQNKVPRCSTRDFSRDSKSSATLCRVDWQIVGCFGRSLLLLFLRSVSAKGKATARTDI
jgi:hypothetical protein